MLSLLAACAAPPSPERVMAAAAAAAVVRSEAGCVSSGGGVYLGRGLFLTAAHLVDSALPRLEGCPPSPDGAQTTVALRGPAVPAAVLRLGQAELVPGVGLRYRDGEDIALLRISAPPRRAPPWAAHPAPRLCPDDPERGQAVLVATPDRVVRSHVLGDRREPDLGHGRYALLALRLEPGESGAGVLDAAAGCLLGIVSHRMEAGEQGSRFVPAGMIRRFLGAGS